MKGDDRNSREKPENLDMDKHPVSLACGEHTVRKPATPQADERLTLSTLRAEWQRGGL